MNPSKLAVCIGPLLVLTVVANCLLKVPASPSISKAESSLVDSACLPATAEEMQEDLRRSPNNPLALFNAVRQAGHNRLELTAYADLKKMVQTDPDNPNLLAAYCLSYGVASGDYGMNGYRRAFGNVFNENYQIEYDKDLAKAEKLDPDLWLIYLLKAQPAIYPGNEDRNTGLGYLRKAVKLAPNITYTHYALASLLITENNNYTPESLEGVRETEIATKLKPVYAQAAWLLFEIHGIYMPNREKALAAKKLFLSELPPGYKQSPSGLQLLANYPK